MSESKGKTKTKEFIRHVALLSQSASDRIVFGYRGEEPEKDFLKQIIADASDLVEHNEWGVALENLIDNLYEVDFKIDDMAVMLAEDALKACGFDYADWKCIEELKR